MISSGLIFMYYFTQHRQVTCGLCHLKNKGPTSMETLFDVLIGLFVKYERTFGLVLQFYSKYQMRQGFVITHYSKNVLQIPRFYTFLPTVGI